MLARTATTDEATFDPASVTVEAAYPALGLPQGARRSEIRSAYRKLVLKVHPDRRGASDDGSAFRRLKAAYDCLVKHTQFDEELDELDEQIEAEERELDELETKRFKRELREKDLADLKTQRARRRMEEANELFADAEDEKRRRELRAEDETRWLQDASENYRQSWARWGHLSTWEEMHAYRTSLVKGDAESHGPPAAVMLLWSNGVEELCVQGPGTVSAWNPSGLLWKSDNKTAVIEARPGPYGVALWMLVVQRYSPVTGEWQITHHWLPHSAYPFNRAEAGQKRYKWAHWADAPFGRLSELDSREVGLRELRRNRKAAAADKKKVEAEHAAREAEAQLFAEQRRDDSEVQKREAHRGSMKQHRAEAAAAREQQIAQRKETEAAAAREQQMAQARQLEYQDAAWQVTLTLTLPLANPYPYPYPYPNQAWLRELAEERAQRLATLKGSKEKQLDERIKEGLGKSDDLKKMKRKREERELARSKVAHEMRQPPAMPERRRAGKEVKPPTPRVPRATTSQDVGTLGIPALRSLVRAAGLSTEGCIEIADLRERAREALALLDPEEEAVVDPSVDPSVDASVDPSVRGSGSTDQPPLAAQPLVAVQPAAAVRKRVTIHESSNDDDDDGGGNDDGGGGNDDGGGGGDDGGGGGDDGDGDDELVLTRRPSFVAATATEAREAAAKVKAGAEAGGARVRRPKLESGEEPGSVKREAPPPWPRGAYEVVELGEEGEPPALKSEEEEVESVKEEVEEEEVEEVKVEAAEVEAAEVKAAEVEAGATAAQEPLRNRSSARNAGPTEPHVAGPASGRRLEESPSGKAAAPTKLSGNSAAPTKLDKGTRLQILWEDDDPPTWYAGTVVRWASAMPGSYARLLGLASRLPRDGRPVHYILYDDRQRQWEQLEDLQWRLLDAAGEPEAMDAPAVEREVEEEEVEEEVVIAMPSEAQGAGVPRTRSKRR